jgi:hypothetical protein
MWRFVVALKLSQLNLEFAQVFPVDLLLHARHRAR